MFGESDRVPFVGLIFFLAGLLSLSLREGGLVVWSAVVMTLFYPPLVVFFGAAWIVKTLGEGSLGTPRTIWTAGAVVLAAGVLFLFTLGLSGSLAGAFAYVKTKLVYNTFTSGAIPSFKIYEVLPWPVLVFTIFGIWPAWRRHRWLLAPTIVGLAFWIWYAFSLERILLDYSRVAFLTSALLVLLAGLGIEEVGRWIEQRGIAARWANGLKVATLLLLLVLAFNYTDTQRWEELKLNTLSGQVVMPAPPANQYLAPGDLKIFHKISQKVFLAPPWKGTVIGVATRNYPVALKSGTISGDDVYPAFISAGCDEKLRIVKAYAVEYVYVPEFTCQGFKHIARSEEGLVLYRVLK